MKESLKVDVNEDNKLYEEPGKIDVEDYLQKLKEEKEQELQGERKMTKHKTKFVYLSSCVVFQLWPFFEFCQLGHM